MTNNRLADPTSFLQFVYNYVLPNGNLDYKAIPDILQISNRKIIKIKSGEVIDKDLAYDLRQIGYYGSWLIENGYPFDAFLVTINHYASKSNPAAIKLLKTLHLFDCEHEFIRIIAGNFPVDIKRIRETKINSKKFNSPIYKDYIKLMSEDFPGRQYNVAEPGERNPCFRISAITVLKSKHKHKVMKADDLCCPESLMETIRPYVSPSSIISLHGISTILDIRPQAIATYSPPEIQSNRLREKLIRFGFSANSLIQDGFPFDAFLLTLEHFAIEGNEIAKFVIIVLETFDCELEMFRQKSKDKSEASFLASRYLRDYRNKIEFYNRMVRVKKYQTSILQKYQQQLSTYPYHNGKGRAPETDSSS